MKIIASIVFGILALNASIAMARTCQIGNTGFSVEEEPTSTPQSFKISLFQGNQLIQEAIAHEMITFDGSVFMAPEMSYTVNALTGDSFASQVVSGPCL